jgi:hypothetical protein
MARIKAWMLATRHTVRDYLDTVVLLDRLGDRKTQHALQTFDSLYPQQSGTSPLAEVAERLANACPSDLAAVDLSSYKGLVPPWNSWNHVAARGRYWAPVIARVALEQTP